MKNLILILSFGLLAAPQVNARTYIDFYQYVYSIPVEIGSTHDLDKVLADRGYNALERDWKTITLHMSGFTKEQIASLKKPTTIYLPPKKSFSEFMQTRSIASSDTGKKTCEPVSKDHLINKYQKESIPYLDYYELLTSRKIEVKKGMSLFSIVENDHFSYGSSDRALKLIKEANGIRNDYAERDGIIHLPFCADALESERQISSLNETTVPGLVETSYDEPVETNVEKKNTISAGILYGSINITRGPSEVSASVAKASIRIRHKVNSNYSVSGGFALAQFYKVTHSDSNEAKDATTVFPEFSGDLTRHFDFWRLALAYDSLNYFVASNSATTVKLAPTLIHRLAIRPSYNVTDSVAVFGGVGYLRSFGEEEIIGYDYTAGASYTFERFKDLNIAALFNQNTMDSAQSSTDDTSKSWIISLNKSF